jgi:hypothetical protein
MVQKLKGSDIDTQTAARQLTRRKQPGAGAAKKSAAPRRENQKRMGVEPDHRTTSMKRGRRGTYP